MKKEFTKLERAFTSEELIAKFSGLTKNTASSFTKRENTQEFNHYLTLLPENYVINQRDKLESLDIILSGNTTSTFLVTIIVGRNDIYNGKECFDLDVFNIAPDTSSTETYLRQQCHHFKDLNNKRFSFEINPLIIADNERRKDLTYATFLTGSTFYNSFQEYEKEKPAHFSIHNLSFGKL